MIKQAILLKLHWTNFICVITLSIMLCHTHGGPAEDAVDENAIKAIDRSQSRPIRLNHKEFYVFPNPYDVLGQLMVSHPGVCFWIDAVCINQQDLVERSAQVNIMCQIHQKAEKVAIWLGTGNGYVQPVSEVIGHLTSISQEAGDQMSDEREGADVHDFEDETVLEKYGFPLLDDKLWGAFASFLERRWCGRTWILQEVAPAREVEVLWGDAQIKWTQQSECSQFLTISNLSK
jgi:hypothetical protein